MWVDCHCHVEQLPSPVDSITEAIGAGVQKICAVSESVEGMKAIIKLKEQFPNNIVAGFGLHPQHYDRYTDEDISQAIDFISDNKGHCSMIGEIGIDYKYATTDIQKERQLVLLNKQIELATKLKLPLNLHSRRAEKPTMRLAIDYHNKTGCNAVLHWFTQSRKLVKQATKGGIFVSVGPDVIYDAKAKQVVKEIDLKYLLLESGGPVDHPQLVELGSTKASPSWIPKIGASIAELFSISEAHLQDVVQQNFDRFINNKP